MLNEVAWGTVVYKLKIEGQRGNVAGFPPYPLKLFLRMGSLSNTLLALKLLIAVVDKFSSAEM